MEVHHFHNLLLQSDNVVEYHLRSHSQYRAAKYYMFDILHHPGMNNVFLCPDTNIIILQPGNTMLCFCLLAAGRMKFTVSRFRFQIYHWALCAFKVHAFLRRAKA